MRGGWKWAAMAVLQLGPVMFGAAGCGGDARLELAAADALAVTADRLETMVGEYHAEVGAHDDARETAVADAFVARVKAGAGDEQAVAEHTAQFRLALERIRQDRAVQWQRHTAATENVAVIREVADGLRRMGVESLTLSDEMRRYLSGWIEARNRARTAVATKTAAGPGKGCGRECE